MRTSRSTSTSTSILFALAVATLALAVSGCGSDDASSAQDADVSVVATTTQVGDFVRAVGGDRVEVHQVLQPSSDPHSYEPRPSDVRSLSDAELVFRSGGDLDEWLGDVIDSSGADVSTIELIDSVQTIEGEGHDHGDEHADEAGHEEGEHADEEHETDPHWWQDPRNAIAAVEAIEAALVEADPDGKADYQANASAYVEQLRTLDRNVAACIDEIPPGQRKLVTTHDALGYYADRYGIEVVGALIPSLSTAAQPSAGDTQELVDQIREQDVKAIFPESSINPKLERAVARETGATAGRALWADSLGPEDSDGATYIASIQSNTAALVDGLTGGARQCRPKA